MAVFLIRRFLLRRLLLVLVDVFLVCVAAIMGTVVSAISPLNRTAAIKERFITILYNQRCGSWRDGCLAGLPACSGSSAN
jgi:hypothetical protein